MPSVFGLVAVSRGATVKSVTHARLIFGAELCHDHYATFLRINPLNAELNPICCLLALLGAHQFLHVSRIRVKSLTLRLLMSHIYIYI